FARCAAIRFELRWGSGRPAAKTLETSGARVHMLLWEQEEEKGSSARELGQMEQPGHLMIRGLRLSLRQIAAMSGALLLEAAVIYAVAKVFTFGSFQFLPQSLDVEFLESNPPPPQPVVLPRLELVQPPPVTVIEPEVRIVAPRPPPRVTVARVRGRLFV